MKERRKKLECRSTFPQASASVSLQSETITGAGGVARQHREQGSGTGVVVVTTHHVITLPHVPSEPVMVLPPGSTRKQQISIQYLPDHQLALLGATTKPSLPYMGKCSNTRSHMTWGLIDTSHIIILSPSPFPFHSLCNQVTFTSCS